MKRESIVAFLMLASAACTIRRETDCPNKYTADDPDCAEYFCIKNPKDSRCVDGGNTMDGGEVDGGPHGYDGGKDASESTDATTVRCNGPEDCTGS